MSKQVQVVYEGTTPSHATPLVESVGYQIGPHELRTGHPTAVPADVANDLLKDPDKRHVGYRFRQATADDLTERGIDPEGVEGLAKPEKPTGDSGSGNSGTTGSGS